MKSVTNNKTILVFIHSYLPGYRGGGPIRSIASLVSLLGDEFNFKIITSDHDFGVAETYAGITVNTWCKVGKAEVYYATKKNLSLYALFRFINSVDYDLLYLNSFFSADFTIKPLLLYYLKLIPDAGIVVAPRGEFSSGALKLKWLKKVIYIYIVRIVGLYKKVTWQASTEFEKSDILKIFNLGKVEIGTTITVATDLAHQENYISKYTPYYKKSGVLKIVFLSRISPMKNLDGALLMLKGVQGDITFNVFGPVEDQTYWQLCQDICDKLDANINVVVHGEVNHSDVHKIFSNSHLFFLPTHGENFGHVIMEALLAGCPVLLSDQTPWKNLDSLGIGWDLPLDKPDKFKEILEYCVAMDNEEFQVISRRALGFGKSNLNNSQAKEQNRNLFHTALSG